MSCNMIMGSKLDSIRLEGFLDLDLYGSTETVD